MNMLFVPKPKRFALLWIFFCGCANNPSPKTQSPASDAPVGESNQKQPVSQTNKPSNAPETETSTDWKGELKTPIWAWKDDKGRVFLQFDWTLEYLGSEQDKLVAAVKQKWNVQSDQGAFWDSIRPDTLHTQNSSGKTKKAMFYTSKPKEIPSWVHIQHSILKKNVLDTRQKVVQIPTKGLSIELDKQGRYSFYHGRKHEGSAELLHVRFQARNQSDTPIVFSPFKWSSKQGKTTWKYHHKTSISGLRVIQPNEEIKGTIALRAKKGSKKNSKATIKYQGKNVGVVLIEP